MHYTEKAPGESLLARASRHRGRLLAPLIAGLLIQSSIAEAAPALYYAAPMCGASDQVLVKFRDGATINTASAETLGNYTVSGRTVTSALFNPDTNTTRLSLASALVPVESNVNAPVQYTVSTSGVMDTNGAMASQSSDFFFTNQTDRLTGEMWWGRSDFNASGSTYYAFLASDIYNDFTADDADNDSFSLLGLVADLFGLVFCLLGSLFGGSCGGITDDLSARYQGFFVPYTTGTYTYQTGHMDGVRVWMDDGTAAQPTLGNATYAVINDWGDNGNSYNKQTANSTAYPVNLTAGEAVPMQVDFMYEYSGWSFLFLSQNDQPFLTLEGRVGSGSYAPIAPPAVSPSSPGYYTSCVDWAPPPDALDHFDITMPASGNACEDAPITIVARKADNTVKTDFTGTVTLSTNTGIGDWSLGSAAGVLNNGTGNDGVATYTFAAADNGVITLNLTHRGTGSLRVTVSSAADAVSTQSDAVAYGSGGLSIVDKDGRNYDIIAGRPHRFEAQYTAWNGSSCVSNASLLGALQLNIVQIPADDDPGVGLADIAEGVTIAANSIPGLGSLLGGLGGLQVSLLPLGTTTFTVDAASTANFELQALATVDVVTATLFGISPTTLVGTTVGQTDLTVRPFAVALDLTSPLSATFNNGGVDGMTSGSIGPAFAQAGESIPISLRAVGWDSADDVDDDGIPDGFGVAGGSAANVSDNATVAGFNMAATQVNFTSQLAAPVGGVNGTLTSTLGNFVNGVASGTLTYSEVGEIELGVNISGYLSSPGTILANVKRLGRFVPARFQNASSTTTPTLAGGFYDANGDGTNDWTCSFALFGQSIDVDVPAEFKLEPVNAAGVRTQNYLGAYNRFTDGDFEATLTDANNSALTTTLSYERAISDSTATGEQGMVVQTLTVPSDGLVFDKPAVPGANTLPTSLELDVELSSAALTDADGVCYDSTGDGTCDDLPIMNMSGTEIRYGRVILDNVYGPETNELTMPVRSEYWAADPAGGTAFIVNELDTGCVSLNPTQSDLTASYGATISAGSVERGQLGAPLLDQGRDAFTIGQFKNAAGNPVAGQTTISITVPDFLLDDRNHDGVIDNLDQPSATATFGIYAGQGRAPQIWQQAAYR